MIERYGKIGVFLLISRRWQLLFVEGAIEDDICHYYACNLLEIYVKNHMNWIYETQLGYVIFTHSITISRVKACWQALLDLDVCWTIAAVRDFMPAGRYNTCQFVKQLCLKATLFRYSRVAVLGNCAE